MDWIITSRNQDDNKKSPPPGTNNKQIQENKRKAPPAYRPSRPPPPSLLLLLRLSYRVLLFCCSIESLSESTRSFAQRAAKGGHGREKTTWWNLKAPRLVPRVGVRGHENRASLSLSVGGAAAGRRMSLWQSTAVEWLAGGGESEPSSPPSSETVEEQNFLSLNLVLIQIRDASVVGLLGVCLLCLIPSLVRRDYSCLVRVQFNFKGLKLSICGHLLKIFIYSQSQVQFRPVPPSTKPVHSSVYSGQNPLQLKRNYKLLPVSVLNSPTKSLIKGI